jgi:23S rRNA (guanosine2251-2'-O)-methyltransferase
MQLTVVLDNVRSVHNVGSIFRTADAAGVTKIYCCGLTPTPLDRFKKIRPDFAKVALGAEKSVAWEFVKDTQTAIELLRGDEWQVNAIEQARGSISYYRAKLSEKMAFIVGNEVDGISAPILKMADSILEIPMRGKKESLNVAVAFGIVAFAMIHSE